MTDMVKQPDCGQASWNSSRRPIRWAELSATSVAFGLSVYFRPFARLFGLQAFEHKHGDWVEIAIVSAMLIVSKTIYLWGFHRSEQLAELTAIREDASHGRMKRMPFASRCALLLATLGLVCFGWYAPEQHRTKILSIAVPLFLLFATIELSTVLQPGDSVLPDPRDELLMFFRARMLKAGYVTAIAALVGLLLISLFATNYVGLLLPILLTVSLLVPAVVYRRMDRQAEVDG
ncbi:MAG: hypothetical protein WDM77_15840 [Steroidobacteraceae bacterium]